MDPSWGRPDLEQELEGIGREVKAAVRSKAGVRERKAKPGAGPESGNKARGGARERDAKPGAGPERGTLSQRLSLWAWQFPGRSLALFEPQHHMGSPDQLHPAGPKYHPIPEPSH